MLTKAIPVKNIVKSASNKISKSLSTSLKAHKTPLSQSDPELFKLIQQEEGRQKEGINLIASENFSSLSVRESQGSVLTDKYAEGYPKARYYGGNQFVDQVELLCQKRALEAFHLNAKQWGVNVQPLSGSPANFITYSALLEPQDRMMGLHLPHGGHLSHGFQTETKKLTAPAKYFQVLSYKLNEKTGLIDYDKLAYMAKEFRPKLIVTGASCYPRIIDVERIKKICDSINAYLVYDMAHISGLVAGKAIPSPFLFSDIVTTTTHKTLRGPRGGMIFYRVGTKGKNKKGVEEKFDFKQKIDNAVFPFFQGGPHMHVIASIATSLKEAQSEQFKNYAFQILKNAKVFEKKLLEKNYTLITGGTDNHLVWIDLKPKKIDGARVEDVLEAANIYVNKNTTPQDVSAVVPTGLRIGTPAITTRGFVEKDCEQVIDFVDRGIGIAKNIQDQHSFKKVAEFKKFLTENKNTLPEIVELRNEVLKFMQKFEPLF